jgi:hypothetical protein
MQCKRDLRGVAVVVVVLATGLAAITGRAADPPDVDLGRLVSWMSGSFSSAEQAAADPEGYFDIRLRMVPIWTGRHDGPWLYVEQAAADQQDRPYRQRVYRLSQLAEDLFESRVYTVEEPLRIVGAWRLEEPLGELGPLDLDERNGCAILMRWTGDSFEGSTLGRLCESQLRGASYATSEVRITASELVSWDRGFDAAGVQVWGAKKGGYVFRRQSEGDLGPDPPSSR